jgi:glycosyltransferase involved in cell wall biosynthesis
MSHSFHAASIFKSVQTQSSGAGLLPVSAESRGRDARATTAVAAPPLKVCIIGLKCFDHIAENPVPQYLGGIETQLPILAKGLNREGCQVSLITFDHGQADGQTFEGVRVFKSYPSSGGVKVIRSFARAMKLWQAMRTADADIYLQMGAGSETGLTALGCKFIPRRARFIFCLASDGDCSGTLGSARLESAVYRYGIRHAGLVISQTLSQQKHLENALGLKSTVIPMAVAAASNQVAARDAGAKRVLWLGRLMPEKRFEWLLEAARRCPEIQFNVAGTPNQPSGYAAELMATAASIPNVKVHGRMSRPELNKLFQTCTLLCCTSKLEGFPTTFLEAWSCGMPVVTTFDPDGLVQRNGLGRVAVTVEEVVAHLQSLPGSNEYSAMSAAVKKYYVDNHSVAAISRRFRTAFEELIAK